MRLPRVGEVVDVVVGGLTIGMGNRRHDQSFFETGDTRGNRIGVADSSKPTLQLWLMLATYLVRGGTIPCSSLSAM